MRPLSLLSRRNVMNTYYIFTFLSNYITILYFYTSTSIHYYIFVSGQAGCTSIVRLNSTAPPAPAPPPAKTTFGKFN